tara:strand:- start:426 stop:1046 length:621 start_codon:yes stop_codon:yes gene_type:complete
VNKSFDTIKKFEQALASFTGYPYAIMTDSCTHSLKMVFLYYQSSITQVRFTNETYISIPMMLKEIGIRYEYKFDDWFSRGEYQFEGSSVWDSARRLSRDMYIKNQTKCISFGRDKPLSLSCGRGGAILTDDESLYELLIKCRYDGRDLTQSPWHEQAKFPLGFHYNPQIEWAEEGLVKLKTHKFTERITHYPDISKIIIEDWRNQT